MPKTYWQLLYHIVWSTKDRQPLITEPVRDAILSCIRAKCEEMACRLYAIQAVSDHVHLLVSVPPSMKLSDFMMSIKGSSSHLVNHSLELDTPFSWQRGCGIHTVSSKDKSRVADYIERQAERHASGDVWVSLERTEWEDTEVSPG